MSHYRIRFQPLMVLEVEADNPVEAAYEARRTLMTELQKVEIEGFGFSPEDTWTAIDSEGHFVWADNDFRVREQPSICGLTPADMPWSMRCCLESNHSTPHRSGGLVWRRVERED